MIFVKMIITAFDVMSWLIIIRVLLSWIPHNPKNVFIAFIYDITELILGPIRRIIPPFGGLDFTPIFAIILLDWLIKPLILAFVSMII